MEVRLRSLGLWLLVVVGWATAACSADWQVAAGSDGSGLNPADALGAQSEVSQTADTVAPDLDTASAATCLGVTCSNHGTCVATAEGLACVCDSGYVPGEQLSCLDARFCPAGQVRVAGQCVPLPSLPRWCDDYCGSLGMACPPGEALPDTCQPYCSHANEQGPGCIANCLGQLDEPQQAERILCGGLMRRFDSMDCRELAHCEAPQVPALPSQCEAICTGAANCDLLLDSRLFLGSNVGECRLYCEALRTALAPAKRADRVEQCLLQAMSSCDPVHMLGCMVGGMPELPGRLCTTAASDCGYIPDVWSDAAACTTALQGWTAGQQVAVGGCLEVGGNYKKCKENGCANPPDQLPVGAQQAAQAMMMHCPNLLAAPAQYPFASEFYAWMYVAVLRAFGLPIDRDYSLISSCFLTKPCPANKIGALQCLLTTPKE